MGSRDKMKLRISKYKHGGWCIEEWTIPKKRGAKTKPHWSPIAYPGNLSQTAYRILDSQFSENFSAEKVQTLIDMVESAVNRLETALASKSDGSIEVEFEEIE